MNRGNGSFQWRMYFFSFFEILFLLGPPSPRAADLVNQISTHRFSKEVAVASDEPSPLVRLLSLEKLCFYSQNANDLSCCSPSPLRLSDRPKMNRWLLLPFICHWLIASFPVVYHATCRPDYNVCAPAEGDSSSLITSSRFTRWFAIRRPSDENESIADPQNCKSQRDPT